MDNEMPGPLRGKAMWISKPIYEGLPYFYMILGALALAGSMYVSYGYWPTVCFVLGVFCLVAGIVVLLKRRDARMNERHGRTS